MRRFFPSSLFGQVLLAVALALLAAQAFNAALLYRGHVERHESAMANALAFRLFGPEVDVPRRDDAPDLLEDAPEFSDWPPRRFRRGRGGPALPPVWRMESPVAAGERRLPGIEARLDRTLQLQGVPELQVQVVRRPVAGDPQAVRAFAARARRRGGEMPDTMLLAAMQESESGLWRVVRMGETRDMGLRPLFALILQTLILSLVLVGALFFMLRRITRPLAALTERTHSFADRPLLSEPLAPSGPDDVRDLIEAHNGLEARIAALLDEKDVMLGAIGHDLKTPLAALRVRVESVADAAQREKMAAGVSELDRMLDDILSLARIGRPQDAAERLDLAALVASVVEEYEDRGEPVELDNATTTVGNFRASWIRRALRNLIDNSLRYGGNARVRLARNGGAAVIVVEDNGPGIPDAQIADMLEPFRRGEASRNRATGGTGLGLTLVRAIAEQHGGAIELRNRADGGLEALLRLPL